jgi:hypothetical protein
MAADRVSVDESKLLRDETDEPLTEGFEHALAAGDAPRTQT